MTLVTCERLSDRNYIITSDKYATGWHTMVENMNKVLKLSGNVYISIAWRHIPDTTLQAAYTHVYGKEKISSVNFIKFAEYIKDTYCEWKYLIDMLVITHNECMIIEWPACSIMWEDNPFFSIGSWYLYAKSIYEYEKQCENQVNYWVMYYTINQRLDPKISKEFNLLEINFNNKWLKNNS